MSCLRVLVSIPLMVLLAVPAFADGIDELERYYTEVGSLSGRFVQETRDEDGRLIEKSEGTLAIQRPNRFNWHYESPFEQDIVADGRNLWVYDVDLEQVTVRPLQEVLGTGPALMLSGRLDDLQSQFEIAAEDGWITLTPKDAGWEVTSVRLRMADGVPVTVIVRDGMGQENTLSLSSLERNPDLDPKNFSFRPPDGVDVIGEVTRR
ncbi:MAG: outer membrane lipoprotein chaperone LolA [Aquisalimonadaceae bacterium]